MFALMLWYLAAGAGSTRSRGSVFFVVLIVFFARRIRGKIKIMCASCGRMLADKRQAIFARWDLEYIYSSQYTRSQNVRNCWQQDRSILQTGLISLHACDSGWVVPWNSRRGSQSDCEFRFLAIHFGTSRCWSPFTIVSNAFFTVYWYVKKLPRGLIQRRLIACDFEDGIPHSRVHQNLRPWLWLWSFLLFFSSE